MGSTAPSLKPCPRCHSTEFFHVPDSLADACARCGFIWVLGEPGATVGQWLEDVHGIPNTIDRRWGLIDIGLDRLQKERNA